MARCVVVVVVVIVVINFKFTEKYKKSKRTKSKKLESKLKGKLMFAPSQLWGKIGRAFLLAVSERQYSKSLGKDQKAQLGKALEQALKQWLKLISAGPPRQLKQAAPAKADVVIFTDDFFPDPRRFEKGPARVGAVVFDRRRLIPAQFSEIVAVDVLDTWIPRATQIVMVERCNRSGA